MSEVQDQIPEDIREIANVMTQLELAARGKAAKKAREGAFSFGIEFKAQKGAYLLSTLNSGNFVSLDWFEGQLAGKKLPAEGPFLEGMGNNMHYSFFVQPSDLDAFKAVLLPRIKAFERAHLKADKKELKENILDVFKTKYLKPSYLTSEWNLARQLDERTPQEIMREALRAHIWQNPEDMTDVPGAEEFVADLTKTLNAIDTDKLLDKDERLEIFKQSADEFIRVRKLGRTMKALGDDVWSLLESQSYVLDLA